ncbi:MAG: tetratricopeptide repeat protein, partial [bacterium]|nr:tetratricopeptide repeat protein [bacterium]
MKSTPFTMGVLLTACLAFGVLAQESETSSEVERSVEEKVTLGAVQLFDQMGPYQRKFTTDLEEAQAYLNQGMVWIQAFNHDEAIRSFLKAAELDPQCAWAWWGVAYCEGPNYNDPKPDGNRSRAAWYALQNALARIDNASDIERDLITALKSRYSNPWPEDRSGLDQAYADAMAAVWEKYPNDADVGALYAEAMMQLKPWQLYTQDRQPVEGTMKIRQVLEKAMQLDQDHAGAKHLFIHAVEPSQRPDDALEAANALEDLVPASGHLLHMPSHIYVQTGHWQKAIDRNVKAVASDQRYRILSPQQTIQYGYQAHNAHMLVFAAMMTGQEEMAMKYARDM